MEVLYQLSYVGAASDRSRFGWRGGGANDLPLPPLPLGLLLHELCQLSCDGQALAS
jgi:hypothetical protein